MEKDTNHIKDSTDHHDALELHPDAACIVAFPQDFNDPRISLVAFNSTFQEVFGFKDIAEDQNLLTFIHPQDQDLASAHIEDNARFNSRTDFKLRIIDKSGRFRWLSVSGKKLDDSHGIYSFKDSTIETVGSIIKSELIGAMDDLPELLHRSLQVYQDSIQPSAMTIFLPNKTNNEIIEVRYTHITNGDKRYRALTHQRRSKFSKFKILNEMKNSANSVVIPDVSALGKSDWIPHPEGPRTWKSVMGIKLSDPKTGEFLGIIQFNHEQDKYFTKKDRFIANLIGDTISEGLKHAREYHTLAHEIELHIERSIKDYLTDLYSRRYLTDYFHILKKAKYIREGDQPTGIMLLDIDDFKQVNDTYGHFAGDAVLRALASFLKHHFRLDKDLIVRWGGEEVIIVVRNMPEHILKEKVEEIRSEFSKVKIQLPDGTILQKTFSIGFTTMSESDNKKWEQKIHEADVAMYMSKYSGKNRVTQYQPEDEKIVMRLQSEQETKKKKKKDKRKGHIKK